MILAYKLPVQLAMKKGDALLHSAVPIGHGKLLNAGIVLRASGSVFHIARCSTDRNIVKSG